MAVAWQSQPRRAGHGLALAVLAAAALHALAWWAWGHRGWAGVQPAVTPVAVHMQLSATRAGRGQPSQPPQSADAADAIDALVKGQAAERLLTELPSEAAGVVQQTGAQWLQGRYASADTLDQSPRPELGWFLDEDVLTPLLHGSMLVQLWVSAEGRIDRAELLHAEPPGDWAERAMRPLLGTPMQPGMRAGHPVAATLVVELVSDNERFR